MEKKVRKIVGLVIAILIIGAGLAMWLIPRKRLPPTVPERGVVLVASAADYNNALEFVGFIENKGNTVIHISVDDFLANYRTENFVIILGGPNSGEGIWELVKEALTDNEENRISTPGHARVYIKENVWASGQKVIIFAGENSDLIQQIEFNSISPPTIPPPSLSFRAMLEGMPENTLENTITSDGRIRDHSEIIVEEKLAEEFFDVILDQYVDLIMDAIKESVEHEVYTFHIPGYPVSWKVDVHFFFDLLDFIDFALDVYDTAVFFYEIGEFYGTHTAVDENGNVYSAPVPPGASVPIPEERKGLYYEKSGWVWNSGAGGFTPSTFKCDLDEMVKHHSTIMYAQNEFWDWENMKYVFEYEILNRLSTRNEVGGVLSEPYQTYYPFGYLVVGIPEQEIQVGDQHYYLDYVSLDGVSLGDEFWVIINMYVPHDIILHYKPSLSATEGDKCYLTLKSNPSGVNLIQTPIAPPYFWKDQEVEVTISLPYALYHDGQYKLVTLYGNYYVFDKWMVDGTDFGKSPSITVTMDMDHTVIAKLSHVPKPSVTVSPSSFMITGENSITFTATVFSGDNPALGIEVLWSQSGWTGTFTEVDNTTDNLGMCTATWVAPTTVEITEGKISALPSVPVPGEEEVYWFVEAESTGIVYPTQIGVPPDFSVSAFPYSQSIELGNSGSYSTTVTSLHGFSLPVILSITGLPEGCTYSFSLNPVEPPPNGTANSIITIDAPAGVTLGSYTLTITGTVGSVIRSTTVDLIVSLGTPELIAYTPDPTTDNIPNLDWNPVTGSAKYTLQYATDNAFTQNLTTVEDMTDDNYLIPPPGLADGMWYWRVKAIDAVGNESAYSSYDSFTIVTTPDFSILAEPSSLSVQAGYENSYTIRVTSINGFNSAVTLSVAGLPEGCTSTFSINPVTPPPDGSESSTLTVGPSLTGPKGTYVLTITGTYESLVHSTDVDLVVY